MVKVITIFLSLFLGINAFAQDDTSAEEREAFYQKYQKQYKYEGSYGSHLAPVVAEDFTKEKQTPYQIQNDILPNQSKSQSNDFWSQPRRIYVQRGTGAKKEVAEIFYYRNGKLDPQQYWLASYMLRDVVSNKMVYVDPKLLDLIAAVQAWLVYYGIKSPIIIHSGFRTVEHNKRLKQASDNSMHLYGKAIDFRVEGIKVSQLAKLVSYFQAGGIGIYQTGGFVHMDTGGIRVWYGK